MPSTMTIIYALALLCVVAVGPGSAQKTEAIIPNFTLNCEKPLVFNGKDDEAACFAKCTPGKCQAVVHMFSGQPGKPTCAVMPAGAKCKPEQANGPYTLKLNVAFRDMPKSWIGKSHNIGGGIDLPGTVGFYHPSPGARNRGDMSGFIDACFAICQFLGCNAIQTDSFHCGLLKLTKRMDPLLGGGKDGKSPVCHPSTVVYYENEKIAPTGKCIETG